MISQGVVEKVLNLASKYLYRCDKSLFNDTGKIIEEEVFTHRLAVYIEHVLRTQKIINCNLSVDCEYSNYEYEIKHLKKFVRDGEEEYINNLKDFEKECLEHVEKKEDGTEKKKDTRFYPDIIVHERFTQAHNVLILECKKYTSIYANDNNKDVRKDLVKLSLVADDYNHAYFVFIGKNKVFFKRIDGRFDNEDSLKQFQIKLNAEAKKAGLIEFN